MNSKKAKELWERLFDKPDCYGKIKDNLHWTCFGCPFVEGCEEKDEIQES